MSGADLVFKIFTIGDRKGLDDVADGAERASEKIDRANEPIRDLNKNLGDTDGLASSLGAKLQSGALLAVFGTFADTSGETAGQRFAHAFTGTITGTLKSGAQLTGLAAG